MKQLVAGGGVALILSLIHILEMCHREGLYQIDLLNGSKNRVTDREYWAQKKGQAALDKQNAPMIAEGITPVSYTHLDVYKRQGYGN